MKYQIYKIDGEKLRTIYNDFNADLNDEHCFKTLVTNTILRNDNALFYQLKEVLGEGEQDSFLNHLIYIDFSKAIRLDKKSVLKPLFDGTNKGLAIKCKDGKERRFIAFDKSNSMSKAGCIYFIDEELKDELDKRLLLNFPFSKMRINSSQYFSYRGLYLSDSIRIDNIELDEKKVLVIDDSVVFNKQNIEIFTAVRKPDNNDELIFKTESSKGININRFDGEGFISSEYAKKIHECLHKKATSFQIRLPFAKGMVHTVDFKEFIKEYGKGSNKNITVKDYFGIERNLDEVEIVLTKSMFKCAKWLDKYIKDQELNDDYDILKDYFHYLNHYKHALYISATNEEYTKKNDKGKTTLNYQFINTMDLNYDEFNDLIEQSTKEIDNADNSLYIDLDEDNDDYQDYDDSYSIYQNAVTRNDSFKADPRISSFIRNKKLGLAKDIGIGKLVTTGENRFLASDLLALLVHLYKQTNVYDSTKVSELYENEIYNERRFYMPNNHIELKEKNYYAILRNPHLSRNEEAIAKPYIPEKGSIMDKYFSHLDGIIMVGSRSLIPSTLGGADFDGDLVKIYSSESIVRAVRRGCYEYKDKRLVRKLPIVSIPTLNSDELESTLDSISYKKIKDTFNSEIGFISNCSIRYGEIKKFVKEDTNFQARCSIIAGLEIDAAKKGWHPTKAIESLQKEIEQVAEEAFKDKKKINDSINYFIETKNALSSFNLKRKIKNNKIYNFEIKDTTNNSSYLDQLPSRFISIYNNTYDKEKNIEKKGNLFKFEDNHSWADGLDDKLLKELTKLMKAYNKAISYTQSSIEGKYKKMNDDLSCIYTNLQSMYDDRLEYYEFEETGSNISTALDDTFNVLNECFLDEINSNKGLIEIYDSIHVSLEKDRKTKEKKNTYLLLFNPEFNDYDDPIQMFKYIVMYIKGINDGQIEYNMKNNKYFDTFKDVLNDAVNKRREKKDWKEDIIQKTRDYLYNDLFKNNTLDAVKYVYSLRKSDRKADFFWDILDKDDILSLIEENNYAGRIIGI